MEATIRFDGAIARQYELVIATLPGYWELTETLARRVGTHGDRPLVVEIGVGTGITTKAILSANARCRIHAIDESSLMVAQARQALDASIQNGAVRLDIGDALELVGRMPSASVDVVASSYTLHNNPRGYRIRLEHEIARVLRPGGLFINNDKYAVDDREEYVRELSAQLIRYNLLAESGNQDLRRLWIEHEIVDQLPERVMWVSDALSQLQAAGLNSVAFETRIGQYAVLSARRPV